MNLQGIAAQLPRPALSRRSPRRRTRKWLVVAVAAALLIPGLTALGFLHHPAGRAELITYSVHYGTVQPVLPTRGALESSSNRDVICKVKARNHGSTVASLITWVIPDGTPVHKGDVVTRLDSSGLEDALQAQTVAVLNARSNWLQAEENYKVVSSQVAANIENAEVAARLANLDLHKYVHGDASQTREDIASRLFQSEADVKMWDERIAWSERMARKGFVIPNQILSERSQRQSAQVTLDSVREEKRVFEAFTNKRNLVNLQTQQLETRQEAERQHAQARAQLIQADIDRRSKKAIWEMEERRRQEIVEEIANCTLTAPQDGIVVYYTSAQSRSGSGSQQGIVAQGEPVREGQILMQIPNLSQMQVAAYIPEALLGHVRGDVWEPNGFVPCVQAGLLVSPRLVNLFPRLCLLDNLHEQFHDQSRRLLRRGYSARIELHAFPDRVLHGHVARVTDVRSRLDWVLTKANTYLTEIALDEMIPGLKPGMMADVTILPDKPVEHALKIPLEAITTPPVKEGDLEKCYVLTDDGPVERAITAGVSDEMMVEVRSGLHEGDAVILNPSTGLGENRTEPGHDLSTVNQ
jgi:multidrug resistance efflux pump